MTYPNLLHPVPVEIDQVDRGTTIYDHDAREPIQQAARKSRVVVQGQVKWEEQYAEGHTRSGTVEGALGYVLFRQVDLDAQSVVLQRGDRFGKIGTRATDVYVTSLRPVGHYPAYAGHTMLKAFFSDRQPSKQTRG
jgi:hypothetical protein